MRFTVLKLIAVSFFALFLSFVMLVLMSVTPDRPQSFTNNATQTIQFFSQKAYYHFLKDGTVIHVGNERNEMNITFSLNPKDICNQFTASSEKLVIFVESTASNFEKRKAIRETWGLRALQEALNYRIVFILNTHLSQTVQKNVLNESWTFSDIIQLESQEIYENLAMKSIAYLKWFSLFCKQTDFIFKTDDDIFIHIPNLRKALTSKLHKEDENHILCHENKSRKIIRRNYLRSFSSEIKNKYEKYTVENIPGIYYPPYCAGFGYGFTAKVANKLNIATEITPYFFLEDVYITGFCREKARLQVLNTDLLTLRPAISVQAICLFSDGRVNTQEMDTNSIRQLWDSLNSRGYMCPRLLGLFNKYIFHE